MKTGTRAFWKSRYGQFPKAIVKLAREGFEPQHKRRVMQEGPRWFPLLVVASMLASVSGGGWHPGRNPNQWK